MCLNVWSFAYDKVSNLNLSHQNSESVSLFTVMWNTWNKVQTQAISVAAHKSLRPLLMLLSLMPSTRSLIWLVSGNEECSAWRRGTSKNISEHSTIHCLWFGLCFVLTMFHHLLGQVTNFLRFHTNSFFFLNLVIELQIGIIYWYCVNLFEILLPSSSIIAWLKQKTVCIYSIWIFKLDNMVRKCYHFSDLSKHFKVYESS